MPPKKSKKVESPNTDNKIINFYELPKIKENMKDYYNPGFQHTQMKIPSRIGVVAMTGGGKSNAIMNYIKLCSDSGEGTFCHIHIYHKLDEPLYTYLSEVCKGKITFYKTLGQMPEPEKLEPKDGHNLVIFDDCMALKDQSKIINYFIIGRKINNYNGCSCIYISQKYYSIPKEIRGQFNYLFLLKIRGMRDFKSICVDMDLGIESTTLRQVYEDATEKDLDFLKIDPLSKDENKMLSKNFTEFYILKN